MDELIDEAEENYQLLRRAIEEIQSHPDSFLVQAQQCIPLCLNSVAVLRQRVSGYQFAGASDEIDFFKRIKPRLNSLYILYTTMERIELKKIVGDSNVQKAYYQKQLLPIQLFFEDHIEMYQYFRSGSTLWDTALFCRNQPAGTVPLQLVSIDADPAFSTSQDQVMAQIMANELVTQFLEQAIESLHQPPNKSGNIMGSLPAAKPLEWTDSKAGLIELAYALQSNGSFNNGKASLQHIFTYLQQVFAVELGNPSRTFQEILSRKRGHTAFLNKLIDKLMDRIDKNDDLYRPNK